MEAFERDVQLMLDFQKGDHGAFDMLYREHAAPLARFFWRSTRNEHLSRELVQETFLKIHRYRANYQPRASFKTYLYTIARSTLIDNWKKTKGAMSTELDEARVPDQAASGNPERVAEGREVVKKVRTAMLKLPERQRTALQLVRFEGMSYADAATTIGVSVKALKSLLNRARKQLLEQVEI